MRNIHDLMRNAKILRWVYNNLSNTRVELKGAHFTCAHIIYGMLDSGTQCLYGIIWRCRKGFLKCVEHQGPWSIVAGVGLGVPWAGAALGLHGEVTEVLLSQ